MAASVHFDPDRLAYFETAGWRAYYDRRWLRVLRLMAELFGGQFHVSFPKSLLAAYYIARAANAWAPVQHDENKTLAYLKKYYGIVRRSAELPFDPNRIAELELSYWVVHRRLAGQSDTREFVETVTRLHSEVFGLPPAQTRESAERRVRAITVLDGITSGRSTDTEGDWTLIENTLRQCYRSLQLELTRELANQSPA